jgi:Ricin-type beta-trefoil lectin domain
MGRLSRSKGTYRSFLGLIAAAPVVAAIALVIGLAAPASASTTSVYIDYQTGLCLDSNYSNPAYPATGAVYTDPCNSGNYQNWQTNDNGSTDTRVDAQTGLCLDSNYSNPAYPATGAVYTDPCNSGNYQNWHIYFDQYGVTVIQDAQTGLCLDSNYSNPAYPATGAVYTDPCNNGTYQGWE